MKSILFSTLSRLYLFQGKLTCNTFSFIIIQLIFRNFPNYDDHLQKRCIQFLSSPPANDVSTRVQRGSKLRAQVEIRYTLVSILTEVFLLAVGYLNDSARFSGNQYLSRTPAGGGEGKGGLTEN